MNKRQDIICVYIYSLVIILEETRLLMVGDYEVLQDSDKIKQCAIKILSEEGSSGAHVSETTDECEALYGQWGEGMLKPLDGYAKLLAKKWIYQPPIKITSNEKLVKSIHGIFSSMNSLDAYVTWPEKTFGKGILFSLGVTEEETITNQFSVSIFDDANGIVFGELIASSYHSSVDYEGKLAGTKCRISFVADENSNVKIQLNGKTVATHTPMHFQLERVDEFSIDLPFDDMIFLLVHSVDFSENK